MTELSFIEVMKVIQEGQIWESEFEVVELINGSVRISNKPEKWIGRNIILDKNTKYKLLEG